MNDKEVLELCKTWFEEIAEKSARLTSGNVSHLGRIIHGFAMNYTEFIESHLVDNPTFTPPAEKYIDLGLPSGTLWGEENEPGYFTFKEANEKFGGALPSREDFAELCQYCICEWDNERKGLLLTGPNKRTLFFSASGYRYSSNGSVYSVGSLGYLWSSSSSNAGSGCLLRISSGGVSPSDTYARAKGLSVRLIVKR